MNIIIIGANCSKCNKLLKSEQNIVLYNSLDAQIEMIMANQLF